MHRFLRLCYRRGKLSVNVRHRQFKDHGRKKFQPMPTLPVSLRYLYRLLFLVAW
uniref:Uncharacterized protein n=1 Tax=Arundo donax TaxID=35708 RepID=A0A0A9D104_ARUDO